MKVLFASWEIDPFFKVGGLGDISHSLPKALFHLGVDIRLIIPFYNNFNIHNQSIETANKFTIAYNQKKILIKIKRIFFKEHPIPVYLLSNHEYFDIPTIDTWLIFDIAIETIIRQKLISWTPDIIHCNDSHTAFVPFFIKQNHINCKTLFTIHNINYQGIIPMKYVKQIEVLYNEKHKEINSLKESIIFADLINTVSPSYAKEILTPKYGSGLQKILKQKSHILSGILNGIDYDINNPNIDTLIHVRYNENSFIQGKKKNKKYLQKLLKFEVNDSIPLIGFIGRFDAKQKGIDILYDMICRINISKYQFVFLGTGNKKWEKKYDLLHKKYPKNVHCLLAFNNKLASQIYAAADFILIPSKFEPCGLIQMIAMHYGTLPIAHATGGLKDSIHNGVNGYLFQNYSSEDLEKRMNEAIETYKNNPSKHTAMIHKAMEKDFSWTKSAKKYVKLYNKLLS